MDRIARRVAKGTDEVTRNVGEWTREVEKARHEERMRCMEAAFKARLPDGYQWGRDAMMSFNFGKKRAAEAIRDLK